MKKPENGTVVATHPVRGKYANLLKAGSNVVILDDDLMESFPDSPSVNRALRAFLASHEGTGPAAAGDQRAVARIQDGDFDPRVGSQAATGNV